jgi:hypothetical protein
VRRLAWALALAAGIVAAGACVADTREPWMTLVADGNEYDGLLISYCWSQLFAGVCADGIVREPPMHVVRSSSPVAVQVRTKAGVRELHVGVSQALTANEVRQVDLARADVLRLGEGKHYVTVAAYWPRGDGYFLFGLTVEKP